MVAVPVAIPVTTPPETVATPVVLLLQTPPDVVSDNVTVLPVHTVAVAGDIGVGALLTVTVLVTKHPVGSI